MTRTLSIRVQRSIFNAQDLKQLIQANYYFNGGVHCRLIKSKLSDSYDVWADNQRFIFRIYRHGTRTQNEIEGEVNLLNYLHEMGLIVTVPVQLGGRNPTGTSILPINSPEGERYAVLFRYIEGTPLQNVLKPQVAAALGGTVAQLHRTLDKLTISYDRPVWNSDTLLRDPVRGLRSAGLLVQRARDLAYLHRITSVLRTKMADLPTTKPDYGLIHADLNLSNIIVLRDGRIGLIDFDFIGEGHRAYDLSVFHFETRFRQLPEVITESFLEGYNSIRPISEAESSLLPLFSAARSVWLMGQHATHVDEWGSLEFSERMIDQHLDGIRASMVELQIGRDARS
jgi:Ser/Thr protein kinase RdoA (MazF antagonist)